MKVDRIIELILKLAPLLQKLLQRKPTPSPEDQERIRREAEEALLKRKVNVMPVSSPAPVSPRFSLNSKDVLKLVRDAAVVGAGVAVGELIKGVPGLDLGVYDDLITPVVIMLLTALRRWVGGPK